MLTFSSSAVGDEKTTSRVGRTGGGRRLVRFANHLRRLCRRQLRGVDSHESLLVGNDSGDLQPVIRIEPAVDVQIEAPAAGLDSADPGCPFSAADDEVVAALARCAGKVTEQVPAAEVPRDRYLWPS